MAQKKLIIFFIFYLHIYLLVKNRSRSLPCLYITWPQVGLIHGFGGSL